MGHAYKSHLILNVSFIMFFIIVFMMKIDIRFKTKFINGIFQTEFIMMYKEIALNIKVITA